MLSPRTEKLQELRSLQLAMMGPRPDDIFGKNVMDNENPYSNKYEMGPETARRELEAYLFNKPPSTRNVQEMGIDSARK